MKGAVSSKSCDGRWEEKSCDGKDEDGLDERVVCGDREERLGNGFAGAERGSRINSQIADTEVNGWWFFPLSWRSGGRWGNRSIGNINSSCMSSLSVSCGNSTMSMSHCAHRSEPLINSWKSLMLGRFLSHKHVKS